MKAPSIDNIFSNRKNLERILDNLKDGIIAHDIDRKIFYFNKKAEEITGYHREEVIGKDCHDAFGGPFCGSRCSFCGDQPLFLDTAEYPINIITRKGETRRLEMTATMMRDENDHKFGVLAAFRDVTDLFELRIKAKEMTGFSNIIGCDSKMVEVFRQITDVAGYDYPVHIFGETGTGKELVANAIHNESLRAGNPFVPINCGALPEGLIESELFGHVKGAFSGAIRDKKGRFELAHKGTIFLDEIAELPKLLQVKLLRFLQEGNFMKVGGEKTVSVDVRVVSATNRDLKKEVKKGRFREDLFYRLNVIPIQIPPIRERRSDIPLLVEHFLSQAPVIGGQRPVRIGKEALNILMDYNWPGNVRELQNAVQFAIVRCQGKVIHPEDLPLELKGFISEKPKRGPVRKLDAESVSAALTKTGGNKARAAKVLGVGRATLYRFLADHADEMQED
ncbi:sigma-54-dependent Fis family transcriptional regulator [Desulfosarcina ovata subsp. sediminis]|uniref:Sigma-54-dependent Fis family transcriptional regulator n=1 Tax=Desulfosarcina ovata subsp. sediminis TaxID=885957 RepID=A0A5K7ZS47_9BACT|nr:sigma 54-interacting transcriptional regulator [Desulfosarcina ovata]BBO83039.1 sigma-54-dependent Fis family transcriptional regulator [Desulfosarcina ovata subsp. sediminis]